MKELSFLIALLLLVGSSAVAQVQYDCDKDKDFSKYRT